MRNIRGIIPDFLILQVPVEHKDMLARVANSRAVQSSLARSSETTVFRKRPMSTMQSSL